ncbi:hypothetical protein MBOVa_0990 [Mycoplasmopsis bovis 8790]|nr:hypothetical protein MBOVa_0990 [Mycoplasmopsis bovis 8790]
MKKKWFLKGGLLAITAPLLSSTCFATNSKKPAEPINGKPADRDGTPDRSSQPGNETNPGNGNQRDGSQSGNDGGQNGKQPNHSENNNDNNEAKLVKEWNDIFNDSVTGADILFRPSASDIAREEKLLADLVKKILEENKKQNEKNLDFWSKWSSKFTNSTSGLDIKDSQLLDSWWMSKEYLDLLSKEIDKQTSNTNVIRKEINELIERIQKIKSEIKAKKMENTASKLTEMLFDDSDADKIKDAEKRYAKELADKLKAYNNHRTKSSNTTADLFSNDWLREIEKTKRDREIASKIYRDSASGLDIDIYLTDAEINKIVKKILEDNYWINKAKFDEALASKETEEIFGNGYAKAIGEIKAKYEKMIANLMAEKDKLNKEWKATESDLAKKEADLEADKNKRITDINLNYEKNKHILDELKNKNNDALKKLLDANSNKDIKSELKSVRESLVDLNDLWWGAKLLADEYNLQKAEFEEMIKKGNLVGSEIEKITELLEKVKTVSDMNEESIRKATAERKEGYEKAYSEAIKEEKDLLSKLDEEDKLLLKVIQELTSWKWDSDQWYYSNREMDGFNHQHIARLKDAVWSNREERQRVQKLLSDKVLEKEKDEKISKLEEEIKAEIEKAKNEKQMLTKTLEKLNAEKAEIVKVISDHSRFSKVSELSVLYNKNQKEIKEMIDKVSESQKELSTKLSEFDSKFNKLQAEKEEINKWLAELEENNEAIIAMEDDDYNSKVDNLDSEAYKLEKEKDTKEAELDAKINKFNKIISELNKK